MPADTAAILSKWPPFNFSGHGITGSVGPGTSLIRKSQAYQLFPRPGALHVTLLQIELELPGPSTALKNFAEKFQVITKTQEMATSPLRGKRLTRICEERLTHSNISF